MNLFLYTLLCYLALPFVLCRLLWRSITTPQYRLRWGERLGHYKNEKSAGDIGYLMFHAVSVGEVHAALPLIQMLRNQHPDIRILLTTSTVTGSARVKKILGNEVTHVYFPFDLPGAVRRFFKQFNPAVIVLMETELWPNFLNIARQQNRKVLLANARLSEKSAGNYHRIPKLTRRMLMQIDCLAAQSSLDAKRFMGLGLPAARVHVTGNMKFDMEVDPVLIARGRRLKADIGARPVLIAASTREGEDALVLQAYRIIVQRCPGLMLVLVPRHPERFTEACQLAEAEGYKTVRFSSKSPVTDQVQILIGDTLGDMPLYYALADYAFVGGSLVDTGCQNIIEPAAQSLPVLTGPSLYNFQSVSDMLIEGGGLKIVENPDELAAAVIELTENQDLVDTMGAAALAVAEENRGATKRLLKLITGYL